MKKVKPIFIIVLLILLTSSDEYNDNNNEELFSNWKKYEINGQIPFTIRFPEYIETNFGITFRRTFRGVLDQYATHEFFYDRRNIGGIYIGNGKPDHILGGVDHNIEYRSINISNTTYQIKIFNNILGERLPGLPYLTNERYAFELTIIKNNNDERINFYIWGITNDIDIMEDLLKAFSTIKFI
jgi:hypothetical protein